jgi:transaldolase
MLIFMFAFLNVVGQNFGTKMFIATLPMIEDANKAVQTIQDENIRANLTNIYNTEKEVVPTHIEISAAFFQYLWVIILVVVAMVMFIYARRAKEAEYLP